MLKKIFIDVVLNHTSDPSVAEHKWNEINAAYTSEERRFHTISHLENMYEELLSVKAHLTDWDSIFLAIIFHDLIYDVTAYMMENDNEDKSAAAAKMFLQSIGYPNDKTERVVQHIMATKNHEVSLDEDTNYIADADLSVLGQSWEVYSGYMDSIRKEYDIYADNVFVPGRIKFLKNILKTDRLFKTAHFFDRYERAARENLERELEILSFN